MPNIKKFLLLLPLLLLAACQDAIFGLVNLPEKFSDVTVVKDINYGDKNLQNLDIYLPNKQEFSGARPVLVFFHGGRWTIGNKDQYQFVGYQFAKKGYVTVIANHRKYPEVKHPDFVKDAAKAIAWSHNNIATYDGDPKNLFVAGHSSGAHIAALAIADPSYLKEYNLTSNIVSGYAGLAGPYDFVPEANDLKDMFAPPENYPTMKVTNYIEGREPPMLLLYGLKDTAVDEYNVDRLEAKIKAKGGIVKVIKYKGVDHREIMSNMTWVATGEPYAMNDMIEFFQKYTK